jgi:hypothetical protein
MEATNPYAEYEAAKHALLLASIKLRGPLEEAVTDYDTALNWLQKSFDREDKHIAAIKWAHGFISNTDKAAADRLYEMAEIDRFDNKWNNR